MDEWYRRLMQVISTFLEAISRLHPSLQLCDPDSLQNELRNMVVRGEIGPDQHRSLALKASKRQFGRGNLEILRQQALRSLEKDGKARLPAINRTTERRLSQLYGIRLEIEAAQENTLRSLDALKKDLVAFHERAGQAEARARQALPDEAAARRELELKQVWLEQAIGLEKRIARLEQELSRLEGLPANLAAIETELKTLDSRDHLARLEASLQDSLLL